MYLKIDKETLQKIQDITGTDYKALGEFLPSDSINDIIEDLMLEIDRLNEELEDTKQDMEENYKRIPVNEQYEVYDRDFI